MMEKAISVLGLCAIALLAGCVTTPDIYEGPGIDPEADKRLKEMSADIMSADTFRVIVQERREDLGPGGIIVEHASDRQVIVARPGGLYFETFGRGLWREGWYDAGTLLIVDHEEGIYVQADLPETLNDALDYLAETIRVPLPMSDLLYDTPYDALMTADTRGHYAGEDVVAGEVTDHLVYSNPVVDWEIWLHRGELTLPAKFVITYKFLPGAPRAVIQFGAWDMGIPLTSTQFQSNPPEDYDRIRIHEIIEENE